MTNSQHDEKSRKALTKRWEELGLEQIKNDFLYTGGFMYVGGTRETQALARAWIRGKDRKKVFTLKPTLWGIAVDLKELGRRIRSWPSGA
jgi:hypothetical protein